MAIIDEIPNFGQYANSQIFTLLADIAEFSVVAETPPLYWGDSSSSRRVVDKLYENLRDVVQAAGFYYEDELKALVEAGGVGIEYRDDKFAFGLACTSDKIIIKRPGSRFSNFHDWYVSFMPSAQSVLAKTITILSEETGRKIDILRSMYRFNFLIYDLESENTRKRVLNSEIMRRLVRGYPDERGMITDSPAILGNLGRVDVNLTRWIGEEGNRRRLVFAAEAPGNLQYSTLWLRFEYIGETYTSPDDGHREPFSPNEFLTEYTQAYVSFLRDIAINGFMDWLLRGYYFKSTAGPLP